FFQAEDGIRDLIVTGVQTCALPICAADDLGTRAVQVVGSTGLHLTDIAFSPDHKLYGVTFKNFYRLDPATGHATSVGKLGVRGKIGRASCRERVAGEVGDGVV